MRLSEMLKTQIQQNVPTSAIKEQILSLVPGQVFNAEVLEKNGVDLKMLIGSSLEGFLLNAKLERNLEIPLGKSVLFQVKSTGNTISLSPLFENMSNQQTAFKAIEAADLPKSEITYQLIQNLMKEGMPIDKNNLQLIYQELQVNMDADLMDLIDLHRLGIEVTKENLQQISSYKNLTHQLLSGIENIVKEMPEFLHDIGNKELGNKELGNKDLGNKDLGNKDLGNKDLSSIDLKNTTDSNIQKADNIVGRFLYDFFVKNGNQGINVIVEMNQLAQNILFESKNIFQTFENSLNIKEQNSVEINFLNNIKQVFMESNLGKVEQFKKELEPILKNFFLELSTFEAKEFSKDKLAILYENINRQMRVLSDSIEKIGETESKLFKVTDNIKQNIDFLNQVNQNFAYIQIPLKQMGSNAHGELYVYSNKKNLASNEGQVSALLHLDMEHLGPLDIFVALNEGKVNTKFCVKEEKILDFLEKNIDLLTTRLQEKGYEIKHEWKINDNNEEIENTTFKELIKNNSNIPMIANYSFDVRA